MKELNVEYLSEREQKAVYELSKDIPFSLGREGVTVKTRLSDRFFICFSEKELAIEYTERNQLFVGLKYFLSFAKAFEICIQPKIKNLYIMLDCSRNAVLSMESVKRFIRLSAFMGYNKLMLYTEDTYEVAGEPYFGYMRGRYSQAELKEFDEYARLFGIELIPCIQTLAHLNGLTRWNSVYADVTDCQDILLVGEEKTYQLIERMFLSLKDSFSSKVVNVGMDEAFLLGAGKYQDRNGCEERFSVFQKHLSTVAEIAQKHGFEIALWSDAFLRKLSTTDDAGQMGALEDFQKTIPENVKFIYWDYYSTKKEHYGELIEKHKCLNREIWFAGSSFTSYRFSAENDLARRTMIPAFEACVQQGVQDFIVTQWGDDGGECSHFSALPSLSKIASLNYDEDESVYENGFYQLSGCSIRDFSALDFPRDRYLFYNDCFCGIYDSTVEPDYAKNYETYFEELERVEKNTSCKFAYLFATRKAYCKVMRLKYNLGLQTREYYARDDKEGLRTLLIKNYRPLIGYLEEFYKCLEKQWTTENKIFGLEVQQHRLGGVIFRIKACIRRIEEYLNGKVERIPEFEETLLDFEGGKEQFSRKMLKGNVAYKNAITINNL